MASVFDGMFAGGALPTMERALAFSQERHRLILGNIANADTPGYRRKDLDVGAFRASLDRLVGGRGTAADASFRQARGGESGPVADLPRVGVLRHDGNNVNLEMELAVLSRNGGYFNQMASLLRKSLESIRMAVAEKPPAG